MQKEKKWKSSGLRTEHPNTIAMLGSLPPIRALSSYCLELSRAVADLGEVQFISFKKIYPSLFYPGGDLKDDQTYPPLNHRNITVKRRLTWYNPLTWLQAGFSTHGDLLHAQWWSLPLSPIYLVVGLGFRLRRKPVVFTVHNVHSHEKSVGYDFITKLIFKLGAHFIVHSKANRDQLIQQFNVSADCVTQIPHGPLDFHLQKNMDRNMVRKEMGFSISDKVILIFGAIRPYKGIDTALKAFSELLSEVPEARLLIAGKLWESWKPYAELLEHLGITRQTKTYLEYIPSAEVWKFFAASDLVILPYHHFDSQSGAGAIAVSFRKPMIVADVGGLPELVADLQNVVPPKDATALARKIADCLQDPERLLQMSHGADAVATKMSWRNIAGKTWSVYEKVLGRGSTTREGQE